MVPLVRSYRHRTVEVYINLDELSRRARDMHLEKGEEAIRTRSTFSLALSGGNSPRRLYELLALEHYRTLWKYTEVFCVDERLVPPGHPDNNGRMLREKLLAYLPIPENHVHLIPTELPTIEECRKAYERQLNKYFQPARDEIPRFDLILLGLGEDGHTASLFPESKTLREKQKLIVASFDHPAPHQRLSFSLPLLNHARQLAFLVSGKSKAQVVWTVMKDEMCTNPASLIKPAGIQVLFLLDRAAASGLSQPGRKKTQPPLCDTATE